MVPIILSLECNPLDHYFWFKIKEKVYEDQFNQPFVNSKELERNIKKAWSKVAHNLIKIRKALTLFRMGMGAKKRSPTSFSPLTSPNVEISPKNFLTFSFNPFATLV